MSYFLSRLSLRLEAHREILIITLLLVAGRRSPLGSPIR
jgi:hypothetical protein